MDGTVLDRLQLVFANVSGFLDRVNVQLLLGITGEGRLTTIEFATFDQDLQSRGLQELLLVVRATNISRSPLEVVHWEIGTSKQWGYSVDDFQLNPKLPYQLDLNSTVDFYVPMEQMFAALQAAYALRGSVTHVCGTVRLRSGGVRRSKMQDLSRLNVTVYR